MALETWEWIAIGLGAALLILIIIMIVVIYKRKQHSKHLDDKISGIEDTFLAGRTYTPPTQWEHILPEDTDEEEAKLAIQEQDTQTEVEYKPPPLSIRRTKRRIIVKPSAESIANRPPPPPIVNNRYTNRDATLSQRDPYATEQPEPDSYHHTDDQGRKWYTSKAYQ